MVFAAPVRASLACVDCGLCRPGLRCRDPGLLGEALLAGQPALFASLFLALVAFAAERLDDQVEVVLAVIVGDFIARPIFLMARMMTFFCRVTSNLALGRQEWLA